MSSASVISDKFVVSGVTNYNPMISDTYALSCYSQIDPNCNGANCGGQCDGGNPAKLLQDVANKGIATNHCVDYSWCKGNSLCSTKNPNGVDLNTIIPNCGCIDGSVQHLLYKIDKSIETISVNGNQSVEITLLNIKKHILTSGPVVVGFFVLSNFISGNFSTNTDTKGIYLENYDYDNTNKFYTTSNVNTVKILGGHAVSIVGWGIESGVIINSIGSIKDVPYWISRNSWSESWGDNGLFKIAMNPINKFSQFDAIVQGLGGVVMFNVSQKPVETKLPQIQNTYIKNLSNNKDFYSTDNIQSPSTSQPTTSTPHTTTPGSPNQPDNCVCDCSMCTNTINNNKIIMVDGVTGTVVKNKKLFILILLSIIIPILYYLKQHIMNNYMN